MDSIDLNKDVLPISAAAAQLARRIAQATKTGRPVIITQKGYPTGVIMSVAAYLELKAAAEAAVREQPGAP